MPVPALWPRTGDPFSAGGSSRDLSTRFVFLSHLPSGDHILHASEPPERFTRPGSLGPRGGRPADLRLHPLLTRPVSPRVSGDADPESDVAFLCSLADGLACALL